MKDITILNKNDKFEIHTMETLYNHLLSQKTGACKSDGKSVMCLNKKNHLPFLKTFLKKNIFDLNIKMTPLCKYIILM